MFNKIIKRTFRKVVRPKFPYRYINEKSINPLLVSKINKFGKEFCLDIGSGNDPFEGCQTLDINPKSSPDFCGDVRELFAPGYMDKLDKNSPLLEIPESYFKVVIMHHILEHVEWIYTDFFIRWVFDIMDYGGIVSISTPNAGYAIGVYLENIKRITLGEDVSYPIYEHDYCHPGIKWHVNKWFNFKVFSGCSPGDYHHSMFDTYALGSMLNEQGFDRVGIADSATLRAVAYKPNILNGNTRTDDLVASTLGK